MGASQGDFITSGCKATTAMLSNDLRGGEVEVGGHKGQAGGHHLTQSHSHPVLLATEAKEIVLQQNTV